MLISIVAVLFAIIGALVYALSTNTKAAELGRLTFAAAMIGLMIYFAARVIRIG
jgi:hypothetical protein